MGEAKRRKESDPNFGRVPKDVGMRGLVVSPPIEIEGTRLFAKSSNLDPQELRFALLFWDRPLVWPSSRNIHFASGPDELFLESAKVLSRPDYTIDGDAAQGIAKGQFQAYQDLDRSNPGAWALSQGENSFLFKQGQAIEGEGALIELHRAIPILKQDVPLAEVLEFRQRRRDELVLLRHQLSSPCSRLATRSRCALLPPVHFEAGYAAAIFVLRGLGWPVERHSWRDKEGTVVAQRKRAVIPS